MSRVKIIVMFAFVLALFAGVAVGMLGARIPQSHEPQSWMAEQLNLTPEQSDQMRAIWQDLSKNRPHEGDARRTIEKQRNDDVVALLSPDQKTKYEQITQQFTQKMQELTRQREQSFADAQDRVKQILTSEQWTKYEQLMQKRRENGSHRGAPGTQPSAVTK